MSVAPVMGSLEGRRCLVIGASRGIGAAVATRLAAEGGTVDAVARDGPALEQVVADLDGTGHGWVAADLTTDAGRRALTAHLDAREVDIVVSGLRVREPWRRVADTTAERFASSLVDNTAYLVELMAALLPAQRARRFGRWIALSSIVAGTGGAGQAAYVAQKAALEGLVRTLALEEGRYGITANVVAPGFIDTEGTSTNYPPAVGQALGSANALGRIGTVEEVAHVVAMLAHPAAGFVTGATIPVSGGAELGWAFADVVRRANSPAGGH